MDKKYTFKEKISLFSRGIRLIGKVSPRLLLLGFLNKILSTVIPFVSLWLSARILNEMAGECRAEELTPMIVITLLSVLLLSLLQKVFDALFEKETDIFFSIDAKLLEDKYLEMDFADVDSTRVREEFNEITGNMHWGGWGYVRIISAITSLTNGAFGIIGAIALTWSFFTIPAPANVNGFLFSFWASLLFAAVLIGITLLGNVFKKKCIFSQTKGSEELRFTNRASEYAALFEYPEFDLDVRMYPIEPLARSYHGKEYNAFYPGGSLDKQYCGSIGLLDALGSMAVPVLQLAVYVFVCLKAWYGAVGIGSVAQYVGAITLLFSNMGTMITGITELEANNPFLEQICNFIDRPSKMYKGSLTTEKREDRNYEIEFRDVSFRYPDNDKWALRHVNMKFRVGTRLAVVGENGSGKSTFIKLLARLYDPTEGAILLNGIDIRKYRYDDYIALFSVVFQDFKLISATIGQNVAGAENYDRNKVKKALEDAGFNDRLASLPDGIDTLLFKDLSEKGIDVSGGEAQKIAIARALYKDAPFIILDEPTAALDPIAEAEIYSKFNEISGDRTAIYISHRLSSCKFCDDIAVFDNGQVVEKGQHEELLKAECKYSELWNAQAQYYVQSKD